MEEGLRRPYIVGSQVTLVLYSGHYRLPWQQIGDSITLEMTMSRSWGLTSQMVYYSVGNTE